MLKTLKKYFKTKKNASLQAKARIERKRLYIEPETEKGVYRKRKKMHLHLPLWITQGGLKEQMKVIYVFLLFVCVVGSLTVIYSPILKVQIIEIIRKDDITDINISYKALENFRDTIILGVNTKEVAEQLKLYQKNISDVTIQKKFPHTLKITIGSYKGMFSTIINQKNYIITENGVLVPGKSGGDMKELKFTQQYATMNGILDYKQLFEAKNIESIQHAYERVKYNLLTESIGDMYYFPKEREIHIDVEKTKLIFDLDGDIDEQIQRLLIFTKENLKLKNSNMLYIDLRVKNKIFFCKLETEFDCRRNLKYYYQY